MEGITFAILLLANWSINTYLVLMLKYNQPEAYQYAESPPILINHFKQWSFSLGYIGLRRYAEQELSSKARCWCNVYFVLHWAFILYAFYLLLGLWLK